MLRRSRAKVGLGASTALPMPSDVYTHVCPRVYTRVYTRAYSHAYAHANTHVKT